ncbi:MAG: hypothetical protein IJ653_07095 [Bacteroidales bacterium]|nr:hypothetical protein [Bacteroidales bacterium]
MEAVDQRVIISDYQQGIIEIDQSGKILSSYARPGNGPGEVLGCGHLSYSPDGKVWIFDEGHAIMHSYREGVPSGDERMPSGLMPSYNVRFVALNDTLYYSVTGADRLVNALWNETVVGVMCPVSKYDDVEMPRHSERHVVRGDHSLFVVCLALPLVEEFSLSGESMSSYDLMSIPERAEIFQKEKSIVPNKFFVANKDACYREGSLYILSASTKGGYHCDEVIVLEKDGQKMRHAHTFVLSGGRSYSTITVSEKGLLYAFNNRTASLDIYLLPER